MDERIRQGEHRNRRVTRVYNWEISIGRIRKI